jgi:nucleotide-binding universal stress UspA family protein
MGARGRSIWKGLLLGSVSSGVLRYGDKDLLIALGSHGKGWLDEAVIGSVASDVARMGQRPVLIVRSKK